MATTVKVTETYDMKTAVGKLGVIGIHTPTGEQIRRLYPGLVKSHRFVRVLKCDVIGACASVLPADPLQVGVTAGAVAPEDMFNPILFKAVTNESFDTLVSKIYGSTDVSTLGSVNSNQPSFTTDDAFKVYYSLLASKGWRKSMPQSGFGLKGLVPLAHTVLMNYGQVKAPSTKYVLGEDGEIPIPVQDVESVPVWASSSIVNDTSAGLMYRGRPVRMPKFPLHFGTENWDAIPNINLVKTFVACIIVPPARLNEFYYRMRVTWTLRFEDVIPATEFDNGASMLVTANYSYARSYDYTTSKSDLTNSVDSVDTVDVDIDKIMG